MKIDEIGSPDFPFGNSHLEITLFEMIPEDEGPGRYYRASFKVDIANDGLQDVIVIINYVTGAGPQGMLP
uniref:hypothetical protein n=1 Tax=Agathobacter sp. TaxID=2021311 RepID=UPI004057A15E